MPRWASWLSLGLNSLAFNEEAVERTSSEQFELELVVGPKWLEVKSGPPEAVEISAAEAKAFLSDMAEFRTLDAIGGPKQPTEKVRIFHIT